MNTQIKDLIIKTEKVKWAELKDLQPNNLKLPYHTEVLKQSLIKNGFSFSFYVWEDGKGDKYIVDGHLRVDVLNELINEGYDVPDELSCTFLDLPHRKAAIKYLLEVFNSKKNPTDENVAVDWVQSEGIEDGEVNWLLVDIFGEEQKNDEEGKELEDQETDNPDQIETDIVRGDIFEFQKNGETIHRLMCGDSTILEDVNKLMAGQKADMVNTDPPYGVGYEGVPNDDLSNSDFIDFLNSVFANYNIHTKPATNFYCWFAMSRFLEFYTAIKKNGFVFSTPPVIFWKKTQFVLSKSDYHNQYEPCFYFWKKGEGRKRVTDRRQSNVWDCDRQTDKNDNSHPTSKPLEITARPIQNSSNKGDLILDLFLGSGSTMAAAHQLDRRCYGMELSEKYCQVVINRMIKLDSELEIIKIK